MKRKSLMRTSSLVLVLFILLSIVSLADVNSEGFAQVFREAGKQSGNIIARVVNSMFYGMMILYRGVSLKISQLCGGVLLIFITANALKTVLQNIERMDIYSIFKMMLPGLIKNLIIGFILVTPVSYSIKSGIGGISVGNGMVRGTLLTQFTEMVYGMFYRLGTLFFNDGKFNNISPGDLAVLFISRPLKLLQEVFGFMTFFAIFTNIAKIILLLFSLWVCSKIIAIYISNIFMALMLTTFGTFYLIFLTMESTAHIGQKGIQIIVVQAVTLFMTVAMMGISYQVISLIAVGNSVQGIAAMAVVLFMLQQVMENISMMAISITSGGGLGTSNGAAFLGLSQALGTLVGGLAMYGGTKLDELTNKEETGKKEKDNAKEEKDYISQKARENVGRPIANEERESGKQLGVGYSKGYRKPNMRNADEDFERANRKKKGLGAGAMAGKVTAMFIQGMTGNLDDFDNVKNFMKSIGEFTGSGKNNQNNDPYNVLSENERQKKQAIADIKDGWKDLWGELGTINLSSEGGSMNEAARINAYNNANNVSIEARLENSQNYESPFNRVDTNNGYVQNLENVNRNNINRISEPYTNFENTEEMIRNSIEKSKKFK